MSTTDVILKNRQGIEQPYYNVGTITLNGVDKTEKTFVYDDGTAKIVLPEVTDEDNGAVLGVVDGQWDKVRIPTGSVEEKVMVEWNTSVAQTVTFEINELNCIAYKIADIALTKEQCLSAEFAVSSDDATIVYNVKPTESNVVVDDGGVLVVVLSPEPGFAYLFAQSAGDIDVTYAGADVTLHIPEPGMYQLSVVGVELSTSMFGSITYSILEEVYFVQSDWHERDITSPAYIKNQPSDNAFVPEATSDDNGKFLRVMNGAPYWATVQNAEEVLF